MNDIENPRSITTENPFRAHEDIVLRAGYGTAQYLQKLVCHLYNQVNPLPLASLLRNADQHHLKIAFDMMSWYARNGENDHQFMRIAAQVVMKNRLANSDR